MTKKTYVDECLERAEKATDGPWTVLENIPTSNAYVIQEKISKNSHGEEGRKAITGPILIPNAEFISHSRTDVFELARRLKVAIQYMRKHSITFGDLSLYLKADELEAPLEEK